MMIRCKFKYLNINLYLYYLIILLFVQSKIMIIMCSEEPNRECCNTTVSDTDPETTETTTTPSTTPFIKKSGAILNCILARQLCFQDPSCAAILEIIPRVCGPVPVACSTATVTKCQAALKTLQAFPLFTPTCLCKEPAVDPECNSFRDFLFDPPCTFVLKKEKDPYPIDALPTCNHALQVCQKEPQCMKVYNNFKQHCKTRFQKCKMTDRESCNDAWKNLRLSPFFGCICPNNHVKRRCDRIFGTINHNPCIGPPETTAEEHTEVIRVHFQSTCHTALDACRDDPFCKSSVQPVLSHCAIHKCNRKACMESLQTFYRAAHEDYSLDIAFCLCKKTSNRHDECMIAQEKLHPVCAQRAPDIINAPVSNGAVPYQHPACNTIAKLCKEDIDCRARLEQYEQSCAVDSVTGRCAGRTSSCRSAMLGILGTVLRSSCVCQGNDKHQLQKCLGWHEVLWSNKCVVEAQKDFHMKRLAELGLLPITTVTTPSTTTIKFTLRTTVSTTTTKMTPPPQIIHPTQVFLKENLLSQSAQQSTYDTTNQIESPDIIPETLQYNENEPDDKYNENDDNSDDSFMMSYTPGTFEIHNGLIKIPSTITSSLEASLIGTIATSTTPATTTTMVTTTTAAPKYCVVQRNHQTDQLLREGNTRRIFSLDDAECSELCSCGDTLTLTCHALCVPFAPCRTSLAFYSHASPAYQAFRGRCLCYSGRFICMRPPPGDYTLPGGVFLLLGYSSTDEGLLRPYTNLGVQDSIRALQHYVIRHIDNDTSCTLTLFNMTDENIIISARLPHDSKINPMELLRKEKAQCTSIVETISQQVNNQHSELAAHRLLSIFKMAEYQIVMPEVNSSIKLKSFPIVIMFSVFIIIFFPAVRWLHQINILLFEIRTRH